MDLLVPINTYFSKILFQSKKLVWSVDLMCQPPKCPYSYFSNALEFHWGCFFPVSILKGRDLANVKYVKCLKKCNLRPILSLPLENDFKCYEGHIILHLIVVCTQLPAAIFIPQQKQRNSSQDKHSHMNISKWVTRQNFNW